MVWSIDQGLVSRSTSDWLDTRYRAYLAGTVDEATMCGEMVQIYAGLREQELRGAASRYFSEHVSPPFFRRWPPSSTRCANPTSNSGPLVPPTSGLFPKASAVLAFPKNVLAAEVKVVDGLITSELVDVPTGPAKAAALRRVGLPHPDVVFGNSLHDLAMLEIAAHPFPVNPSPALLEECAKRGWGYFRPREAANLPAPIAGE